MTSPDVPACGKVYLVGSGPGDPGLISWRGVECLAQAQLVLYDYLVNPHLLRHAPSEAHRLCLGRHGRDRIVPQEEINRRMVEAAQAGATVVRLKGGDSAVFARLAEEVAALEAAGIDYEIVPGITAALAAGSYAGIPLTRRDAASAVALVTGHEGDDKSASLDFAGLAAFPGTLVFYMGVTTAPHWTTALLAAGKSPDTPAAIVRRCTWPNQQTIHCTLGTVAQRLAEARLRPPIIVIIGDVVPTTPVATWFTRRPLFGRRVLLTRPVEQCDVLWQRLSALGAECLVQPAIRIGPPDDWQPVDRALARLAEFDWLVLASANGVRWLMGRLLEQPAADVRRLAGLRIAAIGPGTAEALSGYGLRADLQPHRFRAEELAAALAPQVAGRRVLIARASRGREVLAQELTAAGAVVEQVVVYSSTDVEQAQPETIESLEAGQIDWVTVTSSAIARSLVKMFGPRLKRARLASISPVTSQTLRELGYPPAAEAAQYTIEGVVQAILRASGRAE